MTIESGKKYFAEFLGTFILIFCGTGAILVNESFGNVITHAGISIVFGLTVTAMIYSIGDVSGAHINPAVTVAFWFSGRLPGREVFPYTVSQIAGAVTASFLLLMIFGSKMNLGATIPSAGVLQSFITEAVISFILMFVILNVSTGAKEKGITAGLAIGSTVLLLAMFAGPVSGASMNPARSIGPALASMNLDSLWIYILAPVIGTSASVLCCMGVREKECCRTPFIKSACGDK